MPGLPVLGSLSSCWKRKAWNNQGNRKVVLNLKEPSVYRTNMELSGKHDLYLKIEKASLGWLRGSRLRQANLLGEIRGRIFSPVLSPYSDDASLHPVSNWVISFNGWNKWLTSKFKPFSLPKQWNCSYSSPALQNNPSSQKLCIK